MCGIVFAKIKDINSIVVNNLEVLLDNQSKRGPDNKKSITTTINGSHFFLGHNRLNIVDNNHASDQPFEFDGNYLLFNGEIYNYKILRRDLERFGYDFTSNSDTEVVIKLFHKYGRHFTNYLKGMYSIVLLDKNGFYQVYRDPNGIKPLYKYSNLYMDLYASDPLQIAKVFNLKLRSDLEECINEIGYLPFGMTPWRDIKAVKTLPGNSTSEIIHRYDDNINSQILNLNNIIVEQYNACAAVGVMCSGGVDSTYITKIGIDSGMLSKAYFVDFTNSRKNNEFNNVNLIFSDNLNLLERIEINDDNFLGYLEGAIKSLSIPNIDSAIVPQYAIAERASLQNVKVLLSGIGSDELFKGYSKYHHPIRVFLENKKILRMLLGGRLKSPIIDMLSSTMGDGKLKYFKRIYMNMIKAEDKFLLSYNANPYQHGDINTYLKDLLLSNYDQILMSKSIEGRAPFVDTRIYEEFLFGGKLNKLSEIKNEMKKILIKSDINLQFNLKDGFSSPLGGLEKTEKYIVNFLNDYENSINNKRKSFNQLINNYILKKWVLINNMSYE